MKLFFKFIVGFLALTGAVALSSNLFGLEFSNQNFWDFHGILFLVFIALFPRLTLLFSSVASGGLIWWLGWLFAPRLLVAILATFAYWNQNPGLVVIAWLVALGGESSEKTMFIRKGQMRTYSNRRRNSESLTENDTIETTAKRL